MTETSLSVWIFKFFVAAFFGWVVYVIWMEHDLELERRKQAVKDHLRVAYGKPDPNKPRAKRCCTPKTPRYRYVPLYLCVNNKEL